MKIVEPKVTEVKDFEGTDNFYKSVARAARICYASDKTTDNIELLRRLIKSNHHSPFAHAIVYIDFNTYPELDGYQKEILSECIKNPYSIELDNDIMAFNGRVILESCKLVLSKHKDITLDALDMLDFFLNRLKNAEAKIDDVFRSFIVDSSIGCTREMGTHHDNFYKCEQSTRYCNFSKDKFGGEVAFNKPYWFDDESNTVKQVWMSSMQIAEREYFDLLYLGMTTDQTRGVLPIDTHSRAIFTATIQEWNHIIDLRHKGTTGKPHGDIAIIAGMINEMIN